MKSNLPFTNISISVIKNNEQSALLNLMKMYCYEWSQYNLFDVDSNGVYPFEQYVPAYFNNPRRFCYFVRVNSILAGFALIDDDFVIHKDYDYSMGEFFVMYKYRRHGVGKYLARTLFDMHRGKWEIGFHPKNSTSEKFWLSTISEYTNSAYILDREYPNFRYHDGSYGSVISFDNSRHNP